MSEWKDDPRTKVLAEELAAVTKERDCLSNSVMNQQGDNLCYLTDDELAEWKKMWTAAKDLKISVKLPPWSEFGESCRRFHAQTAAENGILEGCMTIAQLEAECEKLRGQLKGLSAANARMANAIRELQEYYAIV